MIKLYDTLYLTECENENTKTDILLGETNKVEEVKNELDRVVKLCEEKYKTKSYYYRSVLIGNTETNWNKDNTKIVVIKTYNKWYICIDWGSYSHYIRIAFDTENEYKDYIKINYEDDYDNDDFEDDNEVSEEEYNETNKE